MMIGTRQIRASITDFKTRSEEDGNLYLEGYFSVFNSDYEITPEMTESIAPGAFTDSLSDDIRCLTDHDTRLVLGRTSAHTFEVRQDEHGLWGRVLINPNDQDAMNTMARVNRGDVNQCSFGFDIIDQETEFRENGAVHFTIRKVKLYECSVVTFPAYLDTNIEACKRSADEARARLIEESRQKFETRKKEIITRLKGGADYGTQITNDREETPACTAEA